MNDVRLHYLRQKYGDNVTITIETGDFMMVARYFVLFIVFSVPGWVWECAFRTVKDHHRQARGPEGEEEMSIRAAGML